MQNELKIVNHKKQRPEMIQFTSHRRFKPIETAYIGPTNFKPARIRVRSGKIRRFFSFDHAVECPHRAAVLKFCEELNWSGTLQEAGHPDDDGKMVFVFVGE